MKVPKLEEIEENLKGQDVEFIAISVDTDKSAWEKAVRTREMKGTQLYNNGWDNVASLYKVTGVPRFIVINKDGVIESLNASRPTSGRLEEMLLKLLKE